MRLQSLACLLALSLASPIGSASVSASAPLRRDAASPRLAADQSPSPSPSQPRREPSSSRPNAAETKVAEVASLEFHSAFWMNLHHALYAAAWARRPSGAQRPLAGTLPAPLSAPFSDDERARWDAAIDYYDRAIADRSLLFDDRMTSIKQALVANDLAAPAVSPELRAALEGAAPVYRRHFWPAHDRANRAWIQPTVDGVRTIARDTIASLERLYSHAWFTAPVRIDVVWVADRAGAYTTEEPTHATMSSGGGKAEGWTGVEMVFHEVSHTLILPTERELAQALGADRLADHPVLWHVIQFYVTGAAVQQVLRARGIDYTPYLYSTGLFDRAWSRYRKPVEAHWEPYVRGAITRAQAIEWTVAAVTAPPGVASDVPAAEVANLRFHSAFWINLHHTLYGAAWARRPETGGGRRPVGPLPSPLAATLSDDERAAWDAAIDYYDRQVADRDVRSGRGMTAIRLALASEDLAAEAIGRDLRAVLERAAPVYRRHFWPAHDRVNRDWIQATAEDLRTIATETIPRLERLYDLKWFPSPVRIDIVWVGRAYTTLEPTYATISIGEQGVVGWTRVEMVLHEVSHALILPTERALADAFGPRLGEHGGLWHVIQFYVTGAALQDVLRARGIDYTPYMYSTGLFDRAWSRYRKPIEENWEPYVRGTITRAEAIERTVAAVTAR